MGAYCPIEGCEYQPSISDDLLLSGDPVRRDGSFSPIFKAAMQEDAEHWASHTPLEWFQQVRRLRGRLIELVGIRGTLERTAE